MKNLQIFNNPDFGEIRTVEINGEPWFVGKDVASALGYSNTRDALAKHVDDDDKMDGVAIRDAIGREQTPVFINESGLYSLILSSSLPSARQFKRWITSEVLPSIRKSGAYSMIDQAVPETPAGGVADLIRITRRVLLESGSTQQDVRQMTKELYQTYHVRVPTPLQEPAQMNLFSNDYQLMLTERNIESCR